MSKIVLSCLLILLSLLLINSGLHRELSAQSTSAVRWEHLSTVTGELSPPSNSTEQTVAHILDIDRDGINDFVIGTRKTPGPSLVWYRRHASGWDRYVIEPAALRIEAGGYYHDIDGDGDLDIVMGSDGNSNQIWWWENPYPDFAPDRSWTRRLIKNSGGNDHHDMVISDFDGDGRGELVFWNQGAKGLFFAEIPADPRNSQRWNYTSIFKWTDGKSYEGLVAADIDGDGINDIVGGGLWFKHTGGGSFQVNVIDEEQRPTRSAVGQLKPGGRPEVVLVAGDEPGPLKWYEWDGSKWVGQQLLDRNVDNGHSLEIGDVNGDGHLDIFVAEMRFATNTPNHNPGAQMWVLLGDSQGQFNPTVVAEGYGNHESRLGDLDGDGDLDILGKPYTWDTPRLDIWLNEGTPPNDGCRPGPPAPPDVVHPPGLNRRTFLSVIASCAS